MEISINNTQIELFSGATVKDAVRVYYALHDKRMPCRIPRITDKYGNVVALDGQLTKGNQLFMKILEKNNKKKSPLSGLTEILVLIFIITFHSGCGGARRVVTLSESDRTVEILAVNDMHAAIDNFPRFAYMVDSLRAIYPDLLLVSGGDNQTGNPINDQYPEKGMPMIELMNAVGFDLSAIGNHEFDTQVDGFRLITHRSEFPYICSNLIPPEGDNFYIEPHRIIEMPNGVNLVFASMLHLNVTGIPDTHPDNVKGFSFTNPFITGTEFLHLRDSGDVLIYLNHFGFENDVELAKQLPNGAVDLIIGAHSHTRVEQEQTHNGIFITQAENKLKYATLIHLNVKSDGSIERSMRLLPVGSKGNERADVREMVDKFNDNPVLNENIAIVEDDFTSYEQVGYLMVDAMRESAKTDIALVNPGGVRIDHLPKGNISLLQVFSIDPFGNETVMLKLTGKEIKSMLLNAFVVDEYLPIYPSGMKSRYILADAETLTDVELFTQDGEPMDMDKIYTVAMNSYMATIYQYEHEDPGVGLFIPTADGLIEYLRKMEKVPSYRGENRVEMKL